MSRHLWTRWIDSFDYRLNQIRRSIEIFDNNVVDKKFLPYFNDKLVPTLTNYIMQPYKKKRIGYGWTNNNCESANHMLKAATHWKQTEIPKFIEVIRILLA